MQAAGDINIDTASHRVGNMLACAERVDPRLRKLPTPHLLDESGLNLQDNNGFEALSYAQVGVNLTTRTITIAFGNNQARGNYGVRPNSTTHQWQSTIVDLTEKLMLGGAFLREKDFKSYSLFTKQVFDATNPGPNLFRSMDEIQTSLEEVRIEHTESSNRYTKLVIKTFFPAFQDMTTEDRRYSLHEYARKLQTNADLLLTHEREILDLSARYYKKHTSKHHAAVRAAVYEFVTDNNLTGIVSSYLFRPCVC
jgi:hypothetical protein